MNNSIREKLTETFIKCLFYSLLYFVKQSNFSILFHDKNCKHIAATCLLWFLTSNKPAAQLFSGKLCVAKTFILRRSCDHTCGEEIQIIGLYGSEGTAEVGYVTFRRTAVKTGCKTDCGITHLLWIKRQFRIDWIIIS